MLHSGAEQEECRNQASEYKGRLLHKMHGLLNVDEPTLPQEWAI